MPEDQEGEDEQLMSNLFKSRHPDYASAYWSEQLLSHDNDPRPPPPPATSAARPCGLKSIRADPPTAAPLFCPQHPVFFLLVA
ncbi:hypothetical protein QC763_0049610 [Podospora pseudopauciseta]|uniref:Uncharacterized protein n=1 Tax=Podospora pseudopauciseta TaxID=2093780 RepID=A0ABR0HFG8_9PEZI|nr:hypothetical protein QC763_0049610 [Podospora pseudopauciseta]